MSSGSKQILQIAKETIFGVTPSPFARNAIPFTSIDLNSAANKADSASILDSRLAQRGAVVGVNHEGSLEAEARFGLYDDLLASAACNAWAVNTLTFGGDAKISLSIVRGYKDAGNFHTFAGTIANTFELTVATESISTFNFGLMSKSRTPVAVIPVGVVTTPVIPPPYTNVSVGEILVDGVSQAGVACISDFSFMWDNSTGVQRCLGRGVNVSNLILKKANGSGTMTMAWSNKAWELFEKQYTNTLISIVVPFLDTEGNGYTLTIPKAEFTAALPNGGNDDILQVSVEYRTVEKSPTLLRIPKVL